MNNTKKLLLVLLCSLGFACCKKPTQDLTINFQADVFEYLTSVQFYDVAQPDKTINGITLTVGGKNADNIYEVGGTKKFKVNGNLITLGLHKIIQPTEADPAAFELSVTATGYLPTKVQVRIVGGQKTKLITVGLVNLANPPQGASVAKKTQALVGDALATPMDVNTPVSGGKQESTNITLPAGTKFKDAAGNVISGGSLSVTSVHFDTRGAASLNAFPGGQSARDITNETGSKVAGYFKTAGFTNIDMDVAGTTVKGFNQPIQLSTSIDPATINPATGTTIAVGDIMPIWSYSVETGQWAFQQNATITTDGTKLIVNYTTDHLTWFSLGWLRSTCDLGKVAFTIPGSTTRESYLVDFFEASDMSRPMHTEMVTVSSGDKIPFSDVPSGAVTVKVYRNTAASDPTDWTKRGTEIGTATGTLCGAEVAVTLTLPATLVPIKFDLTGVCTNGTRIRPTTDVFYRITGSGAYMFLGTVRGGVFETTSLEVGSTYDFKSNYKGKEYKTKRLVDVTLYNGDRTIPVTYEGDFCN